MTSVTRTASAREERRKHFQNVVEHGRREPGVDPEEEGLVHHGVGGGELPHDPVTDVTEPGLAQHVAGEHERSEEHTSELQSLTNLVCRLLLEKKKKKLTN